MKRTPRAARVLLRVLNARQFCLKLIANVTYGYAAAGFSGRMPMAELADAIVQVRPRSPQHKGAGQCLTGAYSAGGLCMRLNHTINFWSAAHLEA